MLSAQNTATVQSFTGVELLGVSEIRGSLRSVIEHDYTNRSETSLADSSGVWSSCVVVATDLCCLRVMMMMMMVVNVGSYINHYRRNEKNVSYRIDLNAIVSADQYTP